MSGAEGFSVSPDAPAGHAASPVPVGPQPPTPPMGQTVHAATPAAPGAGVANVGTVGGVRSPAGPTAAPWQVAAVPAPGPSDAQQSALALFLVHMFPIGHLPVPASRPARQLLPPQADFDYAAGLRFSPQDHPRSDLVSDTDAVNAVLGGGPPRQPSPARAADSAAVAALTGGYHPLGEPASPVEPSREREWDRRFLVRSSDAGRRAEYAWPPGELFPEGGRGSSEAAVLAVGTELDRFGAEEGRVFAPAATPFARRSLPPEQLAAGYRRYRVLAQLPVWRTVSAPWFAQPGGAIRYRATYAACDLVTLGYLGDVTLAEEEGGTDER